MHSYGPFEDRPWVDGTPLLDERLFWPAYLGGHHALDNGGLIDRAFGVDWRIRAEWGRSHLHHPGRWPYFQIPLSGDNELLILFINELLDDGAPEFSTDFVLRPAGREGILLAGIRGHWIGPGLSWPELAAVAANVPEAGSGVLDPHLRLLLLLPVLGDAHIPDDAASVLAQALASVGANVTLAELHSAMRVHGLWEMPRWWREPDGALVCDGRYSPRNPKAQWPGSTAAQRLQVSRALRGAI